MLDNIEKILASDNSIRDIPIMYIARIIVAIEEAENEAKEHKSCRISKNVNKYE